MNNITSIIVKIAIGICFALITKYLIPYLKTLKDDARWNRLIDMVKTAVEAAEQTIHKDGSIKKEDVMKFITEWLNAEGIKVTEDEVNRLVESAVFEMNKHKTEKSAAVINLD